MSTIATLTAVNALLDLTNAGINALVTAQKMAQVIAKSQAENKPIDATEWAALDAQSVADDQRLKQLEGKA